MNDNQMDPNPDKFEIAKRAKIQDLEIRLEVLKREEALLYAKVEEAEKLQKEAVATWNPTYCQLKEVEGKIDLLKNL